ncbi:helix-turn-helix domain-containing protein [Schaalia sp. Marseille-Q2122]|uniref:helix-turn-helix domain-containing protein n=1 Tax=Schaalia sp. Marseille-Q2122 TaxID=2736604 RepID=UPI00158E4406|nr:helix-turn-helix transcriptional regulator [Schaalia sp. Marseille-Q2122]
MSGFHIDRELVAFGEHVRAWRMVLGLTAQQVCERADISRQTLRKIENGELSVSFSNVAQVLRALGQLNAVVDSVDPLNSEIGRLRAGAIRKRRAR